MAKIVPEIDAHALAEKLKSEERFILLDVREVWELNLARITDNRMVHVPLSMLAVKGKVALPEAAQSPQSRLYVICHHGARSSDVTRWLSAQGWENVFSVRGGIDDYARKIDTKVGLY